MPTQQHADLVSVATRAGRYDTFLRALDVADMQSTLRADGPYTLFAPNDEAFAKFPGATLEKLFDGKHSDLLRSVLSYHFAEGRVLAARFTGKRIRAVSFEGRSLQVNGIGGFSVNGARVIDADRRASNGVLHGIDRVLWPALKAEPVL